MDQQANLYGHGISFNCWPADLHPISDEKHIVDFVSQFPSHFFLSVLQIFKYWTEEQAFVTNHISKR